MASTSIPKEMQAVRLVEFNKPYQFATIPVPSDLGPTDLLVKIAVASYCHTDSMVSSGVFGTELPCTPSHEGAGTVVAVGSAISTFEPGDRVMCGLPLHPCGVCIDCLGPESWRQYCRNLDGHVGVQKDGCMAEYVRVDSHSTTPVPDDVSFLSAAPLACAGRTVWRGVLETELKPGQWVAIVGSGGGLGHLGIEFAKKVKGLNVVGVDARDRGLELSKKCGADVVVDARKSKKEVVAEVQSAVEGGADATIVLSDAPDAAALSCAITKMHGTVIQIAQPDDVVIPFHEFVFRDIRVRGSLLCSPKESRNMLKAVAEHGISAKTHPFYGLDKIEELLELVREGEMQGKAAIVVDSAQMEAERERGAKY